MALQNVGVGEENNKQPFRLNLGANNLPIQRTNFCNLQKMSPLAFAK